MATSATRPPLGTMDIWNYQSLMQILFPRASAGLKTKFEANRAKNDIFCLWGAPLAPLETMDFQNCQRSTQILSLHVLIILQSKF